MLRNSHSPSSSRETPIVTRSYSRLTEIAIQQTPTVRALPNARNHIKTVERNLEIADDDDDEEKETRKSREEDEMNTSRFIYKQHFSATERLHMFWVTCKSSAQYSWKTFKRQFVPGVSTVKDIFIILVLSMLFVKYLQDNFVTLSSKSDVDDLKNDIDSRFNDISEKHRAVIDKLEHLQKMAASAQYNDDSKDLEYELKMMKEQIDGLKNELGDHKYQIEKSKNVEQLMSPISIKTSLNTIPGVNVANSLIGAKIDEKCSSHSVSAKDSLIFDMVSYFMSFKDGYVLLDREILQPGEAWCTYDDRASLTIKLAKSVHPTVVSYQHVKWNGIVPNNAPKIYDVVACHSPCCTESTPLATNCTYDNLDGQSSQEQLCSVENRNGIVVDRVQFRFKENQGNMTKTCAYLVRVYGTIVTVPISTQSSIVSSPSEVLLDYSHTI